MRRTAIIAALSGLLLSHTPASAQIVPGSMDVHWQPGAKDCSATPEKPLQIHAYNSQTFILRQSLCADLEGNLIYLLFGSERALLIDTGAVADPQKMPLARQVLELIPAKGNGKLPLLVVHTHSHLDHRAGDPQFQSLPGVEVVPPEENAMRQRLRFTDWPNDVVQLNLGDRTVDVIPTPGHHPSHIALYDRQTGLLFSGDFLLPGRLVINDLAADRKSARRVVEFFLTRPLTHILGAHIELDAEGNAYGMGSHYHPNEHRLELSKQDLFALPTALDHFNGFYAKYPAYILSNPIHNLAAIGVATLALIVLLVWVVRKWRQRRRAVVSI
ncbi:MAG: MBL fold metallo-hydrolase [Chthoniobacterales bacterium]